MPPRTEDLIEAVKLLRELSNRLRYDLPGDNAAEAARIDRLANRIEPA